MTEKTIKSYQEQGKRIQLVKINFENNSPYYQIRLNRQIKHTNTDLIKALGIFRNTIINELSQTKLDL